MPRFFSVAEANALLPRLTYLLRRLTAARDAILSRQPDLASALAKSAQNGGNKPAALAAVDFEAFQSMLNEIKAHGVLVKDLDIGLLDFPALRDGREVYLCWKRGERRVSFWHEVDAGYAGRRPLD